MTEQPEDGSKDFLLMEYQQIAAAHFQDQQAKINLYQYYVALVTVPISLIAAAIGVSGSAPNLSPLDFQEIGVILTIVSIAAFLLMNMIMDVRFEAKMYAKTVNLIRKWFYDHDNGLGGYLVLPITDSKPKFYGGRNEVIQSVGLPAVLDSMLLGLGILFISKWVELAVAISVLYGVAHLVFYAYNAKNKDKAWTSTTASNPGANVK